MVSALGSRNEEQQTEAGAMRCHGLQSLGNVPPPHEGRAAQIRQDKVSRRILLRAAGAAVKRYVYVALVSARA